MKLRAPDTNASCSHNGNTYSAAADGSVEVPDHLVHVFAPHGFVPWIDSHEEAEPDDQFTGMKRRELFAWLREHGIGVAPPRTLTELRAICREAWPRIALDAAALAVSNARQGDLLTTPSNAEEEVTSDDASAEAAGA